MFKISYSNGIRLDIFVAAVILNNWYHTIGMLHTQAALNQENLWLKYSKGQFGYSIQKELWESPKVNQDFEKFCRLIGWNKMDNGIERKLRWFGKSEFIYDLKTAPKGHLPLTSAFSYIEIDFCIARELVAFKEYT